MTQHSEMAEHEKPWDPLTVSAVGALLADASFPWWIAGGIALELAIGRRIRDHADIDVLVLRRDHLAVRNALREWDCWAADPPGSLKPWPVHQQLKDTVHDIWCRGSAADRWRFQLMLDESRGDMWISRRDERVRAPLASITRTSSIGIPYLAPHVQLYYKAKNPRPKDEVDFHAFMASATPLNAPWLRNAISLSWGTGHPWLASLG